MLRALSIWSLVAVMAACSATTGSTAGEPSRVPSSVVAATPAAQVSAPATTASDPPLADFTHTMDELKASRLEAEIQVGGRPDWQATLNRGLWVSTGGEVVRIDQKSNEVGTRIDVANPCFSLEAGFGSIWAPSCATNELVRIDPVSNKIIGRIPLGGIAGDGEGQLVVGSGSVWLFTDDHGSLARIDPKLNTVAQSFHTDVAGISLAAAEGSLWATVPEKDSVVQLGLDGKIIRTIPVGKEPRFIAAGEGGVWSLGQDAGDVTRIDPKTGRVIAKIDLYVPGDGGCIATGGGAVWVTMPGTPVSRIDPATNAVSERFKGAGGDCISFSEESVWLSNLDLGTVWRIRP
jgi:virginiamycin B lyase